MIAKYISGNSGRSIILNQGYDINIKACNPYQSAWKYESTKKQYGIEITEFGKDPVVLSTSLKFRGTRKSILSNVELFFRECEKDVLNMTPGKLAIGEHYLRGYVIERSTDGSSEFYGKLQEFKFLGIDGMWIRELSRSFYALTSPAQPEGLGYSYDYLYDYSAEDGDKIWQVDHYAASDYEMVIYGPCIDPRINIAGHPYEIFDTVEKGEYVIINSQNHTAVKHRTNGTKVNLFDFRGKINRLFTKIPGGNIPVSWSGSFGFDITLFLERSEPAW